MCLDTLSMATADLSSDIYVVDNASNDGTVEHLRQYYKWVNIIDSGENVGFSRANNMALAQCRGRVVLILNPDTIVPRHFLTSLVCHFAGNDESCALGVQMTNGKGLFLKESKRGYPDIMTSFFKLTGLWKLAPESPVFNGYYVGQCPKNSLCKAPILSGACMAFTHDVMDRVGMFDPSYFMYGEDIDLSWRMNCVNGSGNDYRGDLNMIHFKGISTPRRMKYIYSFYDAMIRFSRKYEHPKHCWLTNAIVSLGVRLGFCIAALRCGVMRFVERKYVPCAISNIAVVSDDTACVADFRGQVDSSAKVDCHSVESLPMLNASAYDAVVFDIAGDIDAYIDYMKRHACQTLFGFYSSKSCLAFVYEGNGCRVLFG